MLAIVAHHYVVNSGLSTVLADEPLQARSWFFYFFGMWGKTGINSFMLFKNLQVPQSQLINTVAASTFGVLLIHANSDAMRQWLWKDTLQVPTHFLLIALVSVIGVFTICTVIDIARARLTEPWFIDKTEKFISSIHARITKK